MAPSVRGGYLLRCDTWSDIQEYLPLLHGCARVYDKCRVLELGVREGNSTLAFLAAAQATGGHVWSVDIDPSVPGAEDGMGPYAECGEWTFICGDSTDPAVAETLPEQIDVFFDDASHLYEETLAELDLYMPRLAPGGVALFHDTRLNWDYYAVRRALDDWCAGSGLTWHELPSGFGMGVIHVPADGIFPRVPVAPWRSAPVGRPEGADPVPEGLGERTEGAT